MGKALGVSDVARIRASFILWENVPLDQKRKPKKGFRYLTVFRGVSSAFYSACACLILHNLRLVYDLTICPFGSTFLFEVSYTHILSKSRKSRMSSEAISSTYFRSCGMCEYYFHTNQITLQWYLCLYAICVLAKKACVRIAEIWMFLLQNTMKYLIIEEVPLAQTLQLLWDEKCKLVL